MIDLRRDLHVHSTFSDGRHDVDTNVRTAAVRGLSAIGLVDHVSRDTTWLADYVAAVDASRRSAPIEVRCGIEVKILDESGTLDLPVDLGGVDDIVIADHQLPLGGTCHAPAAVRSHLATHELTATEVIGALLEATARAAERHDGVLIAHLFSVLPKAGLNESDVSDDDVRALGRRLAAAGARVEVSERWRCPSARVATVVAEEGVELVASTDSHRRESIGLYDYVADVARLLP